MTEFCKNISGALCACSVFLFGNDPTNLKWLYAFLVLMALDLLLGTLEAIKNKAFKRQQLLEGLYRKVSMLMLVVVAQTIDSIHLIGETHILQRGVTGYLIGYEALSIMSHISIAGVPIPALLKNAIQNYLNKSGGEIQK